MSIHDCPCCTCGLVTLDWSDRSVDVDPDIAVKVADAICSCALDNYYDRTRDGIPYGISTAIREACAPVVARFLSAIDPEWEHRTVCATVEQREALLVEIVEIVTRFKPSERTW